MSCARALDLVHFGGVVVLHDFVVGAVGVSAFVVAAAGVSAFVMAFGPLAVDILGLVGSSMLGNVGLGAPVTVGAGSCPVEFGAVGGVAFAFALALA